MTDLLLDASVWLAARDAADRFHDAAVALVSTRRVHALDLTLYEVANVAAVRWRDPDEARRLLDLVVTASQVIARIDDELAREAVVLTASHDLSVYDAAYAACAADRGWTLVSADLRDLVAPGLAVDPARALGG